MGDFVTVTISAYNRLDLLQFCLDSIWTTEPGYPYELIVHDDGSRRDTSSWLYEQVQAGRISSLILNPPDHNRGHGTSVNRATNIGEGDWIMKLNGDEEVTPNWLGKCVAAMNAFPQIRLLHAAYFGLNWTRHTEFGDIQWVMDPYTIHRETRNGISIRVVWVGPGDAFMVTRQTWEEMGPWYAKKIPSFAEDMDYRLRLCPMMSLLEISHHPVWKPVTDLEAHWQKYKGTPWLGLIDPPVVSYHRGDGLSSIHACRATLKDGPLVFNGRVA